MMNPPNNNRNPEPGTMRLMPIAQVIPSSPRPVYPRVQAAAAQPPQPKKEKLPSGWATPEGLIILSFILICIFSLMQLGFHRAWVESIGAFRVLSGVIFFMFLIIALWGFKYLITERRRIWSHEREGLILLLIGSLLTMSIPISAAVSGLAPEEFFGTGLLGVNVGSILILVGAVMIAWFGGYFTIWFIGLVYYLVMSSHEAFLVSIYTHHYGPYDQFYGTLGVYLIILSAVLLLYHELKFFMLGRLIKRARDHCEQGRYLAALKPLKTALHIYPRYATAWNNKGNIFFNQGNFTEALECYEKALKISPDYQLAVNNKALAMQKHRSNPNVLR